MRHVGDILSLSYGVRRMMDELRQSVDELETGGETVTGFLDRIRNTADHCSAACTHTLDKYAGKTTKRRFSEIFIADVLQDVRDELSDCYGEMVQFDLHCTPSQSERLCHASLRKITHGLMKQAAEATIARGECTSVSVFVHRRGGDLKIDVQDRGIALDEPLVRQFAERASEVAKRGGDYSDVGLPGLFALAVEMGGRLALRHTGQDGNGFRLSLPSSKPMEGAALGSRF